MAHLTKCREKAHLLAFDTGKPAMGRRGSNSFRRNDVMRAMRAARDAGLDPETLEIAIQPDGAVTFRVRAKGAAQDEAGAGEWRKAIEELKAKGKTKER